MHRQSCCKHTFVLYRVDMCCKEKDTVTGFETGRDRTLIHRRDTVKKLTCGAYCKQKKKQYTKAINSVAM